MTPATQTPISLTQVRARHVWLRAQRLDAAAPFGDGPAATLAAIAHLGYVQIDTIHVIERCHHHILWSRIPGYQRGHLRQAQTVDKTVFEYWTHALSYVPSSDLRFFLADMKAHRKSPKSWFNAVSNSDLRRVVARIRDHGPLSIRDIADDVLVEKDHAWASRKPSKRALQLGFYTGMLTISERSGMLKTYELMDRHFQWDSPPRQATESQIANYLLDRALRSQGVVSLDSICHLNAGRKPLIRNVIESRLRRGSLVPVAIEAAGKQEHWAQPQDLIGIPEATEGVHILSPFDPLIIQRKRLKLFFDYEHLFEAYLPREKRVHGYMGLPVLVDGEIVAVVDLKADRTRRDLQIQQWSWVGKGQPSLHMAAIEQKLHQFEGFQFAA